MWILVSKPLLADNAQSCLLRRKISLNIYQSVGKGWGGSCASHCHSHSKSWVRRNAQRQAVGVLLCIIVPWKSSGGPIFIKRDLIWYCQGERSVTVPSRSRTNVFHFLNTPRAISSNSTFSGVSPVREAPQIWKHTALLLEGGGWRDV